ncbi:hypothetical protein EJI01_20915 [Variovorax sp. MHTC-1]|nr:hypothetical protein EJI01_20915 [Variovorax sp. MHTC-1]
MATACARTPVRSSGFARRGATPAKAASP